MLRARGRCGGPLTRWPGHEADREGFYVYGCTSLHPGAELFAGRKFRTCPIAYCHPDIHPEVAEAFRGHRMWKRFGFEALKAAPSGVLELVEVLDDELTDLTLAIQARRTRD